jgi:hypothetical protein
MIIKEKIISAPENSVPPKLKSYVNSRTNNSLNILKGKLENSYTLILQKMGWPNPMSNTKLENIEKLYHEFCIVFNQLTALQKLYVVSFQFNKGNIKQS